MISECFKYSVCPPLDHSGLAQVCGEMFSFHFVEVLQTASKYCICHVQTKRTQVQARVEDNSVKMKHLMRLTKGKQRIRTGSKVIENKIQISTLSGAVFIKQERKTVSTDMQTTGPDLKQNIVSTMDDNKRSTQNEGYEELDVNKIMTNGIQTQDMKLTRQQAKRVQTTQLNQQFSKGRTKARSKEKCDITSQ